ncbi:hypothetical protein TRIP_C20526 [Candidatus Zixiibacteriota bacterium]|nr:hypothetical protein TRIP_C20526 [candidate division Zixibacteria bacterium]
MMPTAIRPKGKSGFYIGVTCPGCGGELELENDFFVLTCPHCGSVLRVVMPEVPPAYVAESKIEKSEMRPRLDRYLKDSGLPLTGTMPEISALYYPYWKIDAIVLKLRNRIEERIVAIDEQYNQEVTVKDAKTDIALTPFMATVGAGPLSDDIPYSLGVRAEYIKLRPYAQENIADGFECFPVIKPWTEVLLSMEKNVAGMGNIVQAEFGRNRTELFHPQGAVVFFPYFIITLSLSGKPYRFVMDGMTGRVTQGAGESGLEESPAKGESQMSFGRLAVVLHRCPECGVDLPREQSYVYICHNCQRLIQLERYPQMLQRIGLVVAPRAANDRRYPFWAIELGEKAAVVLRKMFGGIYNSGWLVVPAFKMANFEGMFKLAKRMSSAYPKLEIGEAEDTDGNYHPVSVGLHEALALAEVIIYREKISRDHNAKGGHEVIAPERINLFYMPFHAENYFLVDSVMKAVTFEKRAGGFS